MRSKFAIYRAAFTINLRPCAAFYSVERVGGGVRRTPSRSAPDRLRASWKQRACCAEREEADGTQI